MSPTKIMIPFYNMEKRTQEDTFYFFLEHLLRARIELHRETGKYDYDEEVNMYVAGLLESLATARNSFQDKPYLSPFDHEVRNYIASHPGLRNEYIVYKENADFALVSQTVFDGFYHKGSYHRRAVNASDYSGRIALYYKLAASALGHLQGTNETLVQVLFCLGHQIAEMAEIVHRVATDYFDFIQRLSEGSFYHLQRELIGEIRQREYTVQVDDFLRKYNEFQKKPSDDKRKELISCATRLKQINPEFNFDCGKLYNLTK
ncbi:MAG: hypothetical protein JW795_16340 [Chitinivibrionales bacterium]|nr:hypothetical protein [Chitinivibrionales bacterium]